MTRVKIKFFEYLMLILPKYSYLTLVGLTGSNAFERMAQ
jgi:hypothetical protein